MDVDDGGERFGLGRVLELDDVLDRVHAFVAHEASGGSPASRPIMLFRLALPLGPMSSTVIR